MVEQLRLNQSIADFQKKTQDFAKERNNEGVFGVSFVFDVNLPNDALLEMVRKSDIMISSLTQKGLNFDVSYSFSGNKRNVPCFFTRRDRPTGEFMESLAKRFEKTERNDSLHMILNDFRAGRVDSLADTIDSLENRPRLIVLMSGEQEYPDFVNKQIEAIEEKGSVVLKVMV